MGHEFNNPLGIIMGFVEDILAGADLDHPDYQSLQIIDEETKRCQKIIQGSSARLNICDHPTERTVPRMVNTPGDRTKAA